MFTIHLSLGRRWLKKDVVQLRGSRMVMVFLIAGCAAAPSPEQLNVLTQGSGSDEEPTDSSDESAAEDDEETESDSSSEEDDSRSSADDDDTSTDAPDESEAVDATVDAASRDAGASRDGGTQTVLDAGTADAGTAKDAGRTDAAPSTTNPGAAASCSPSACRNNCLLLNRCCDVNDECACEEPLTRQCTLPSLPGLLGP